MNIYVGNLSRDVTENELRQEFESFGEVNSVSIIKDRYTGNPRGFGFIEMPVEEEAKAAIDKMNGKELNGREIKVNTARERSENSRFSGSRNKSSW